MEDKQESVRGLCFKEEKMTENKVLFSKQAGAWFKGLAILMVVLSHFAEWWSWFQVTEGTAEIIRIGCTKLGPYGVAIFFLFSGYGLTKSAGKERIGMKFILKRFTGVYIPYVMIVFLIEILSDGLHTWEDILDILDGHDFWYMTVLFLFYIAFIVLWLVFKNMHIRAVGIVLFTVVMSHRLYAMEQQDFWYLSNPAFALGVLLALYEPVIKKIPAVAQWILTGMFAVVSGRIVYSGLFVEHIWETPEAKIQSEMWAVFGFTLFIVFLAASWKRYDAVLQFLGKYSLYFYILHTFIFMWVINHVSCEIPVRFALAAVAILVFSIGLGVLIGFGMKQLNKVIEKKFTQKEEKAV